MLLTACALIVSTTACDGPVGPQGDAGPQGEQGPEGPEGPQGPAGEDGEDGNANVTTYVFDGHDFRDPPTGDGSFTDRCIPLDTEQQLYDDAWLYYMTLGSTPRPVPATIAGQAYYVFEQWDTASCTGASQHRIIRSTGSGFDFNEIRIVRIEASNTEDCTGGGCLRTESTPLIPEGLDVTDYNAVVEYYGLTEDDIVRM